MTDAEKALLDEAARLRGWSSAQLLREAALEKARHLIEFSKRDIDCHQLAQRWAERIVAPSFRLTWNEGYLEQFDGPDAELFHFADVSSDEGFDRYTHGERFPFERITGEGATPEQLIELKEAVDVCGGPLLDLIFRYAARGAVQATSVVVPGNESRKAAAGSQIKRTSEAQPKPHLSDDKSTSTK